MYEYPSYMYHYGVLGMKWGVRRYRNSDGSLTRAGKKRLAKKIKKAKSREEIVAILDKDDTIQNTRRNIHSNKKIKKLKNEAFDLFDAEEAQRYKDVNANLKKAKKDVDKWWNTSVDGPKEGNYQYEKAVDYTLDAYPLSKKHSQLKKAADNAWETYYKELDRATKSAESLLGKYGDRSLKTLPNYTINGVNGYKTANEFITEYMYYPAYDR